MQLTAQTKKKKFQLNQKNRVSRVYLKKSRVKIGQCDVKEVVLDHVDDSGQRDLEKVHRLLQNVL